MKNIVGIPARQENFFRRDSEIEKIKSRLNAGNNLQIAAPRRVGKTSILFYLLDNDFDGNVYVYVDTERIDSEQDFYKKLLKEIIKVESIAKSGLLQDLLKSGSRFFKKVKSLNIMGQSIEFNEEAEGINSYEELSNFLCGFELEDNKKLVLLIDEFPQTIINIIEANNGDIRKAIQFLQSNRELRLDPDIMSKVQFIYTGSIGLNHTVASINASAFVNDLNSVEVEPLSTAEGKQLVRELMFEKGITMDENTVNYLLQKINWLIPFHIQLAIQEICSLCRQTKLAGTAEVDRSFDNMVANRNNSHFEHYYSRLKSQFKNDSFKYAEMVLQNLATNGTITSSELYNQAVGIGLQNQYRRIVEVLVYDGYINNIGDKHIYQFNSPVVRLWWQRYICK